MKIIKNASIRSTEVKRLCDRDAAPTEEIATLVKGILADVKANGMPAVESYAKKFDNLEGKLKVSSAEIKKSANKLDKKLQLDLKASIRNVRNYHKHQIEKSWEFKTKDGSRLGQRIRPLNRVGIYVPGGSGIYPSTLIMNAVPALIAGVKEIVAVTPVKGELNPALAFCMLELGVSEVYKIGGAQAIAMLAYGAGKVKKVDKIVGPGNVYAAYAKKEVFGTVDIDMIAGPSEILVMADETADPDWVAADLLSQAEHGSGFEAAVCITDSLDNAKMIKECIEIQVEGSPVAEKLQKCLDNFGRILVVKNWNDGVAIANYIAPEHLEIMTKDARKLAERIDNAGAIFIGPWSCEPIGDYWAGPNHVLPTNGTARFSSPLGVYDFIKRTSIIEYSKKENQKSIKRVANIAFEEGFVHHAMSALKRLVE